MRRQLIPRAVLLVLIAIALVTPIGICVILAAGRLLGTMGDAAAGGVLDWIALAFGGVWLVDLICLVLAHAVNSLSEADDPPGDQ